MFIFSRIVNGFKTVDYKLYFAIFITKLLPTIYQTFRIYFVGTLPSDSGVNIASQLSWVSLFYEVIQEALLLPLFNLLGQKLNDHNEFINRIRTGLIVVFLIYMVVVIIFRFSAEKLVELMAQDQSLISQTVTYVRLEAWGYPVAALWNFMYRVILLLEKNIFLLIMLIIQLVLTVLLDLFFLSNYSFSLRFGVNGIAYSNWTVNIVLFVVSLIYLWIHDDIRLLNNEKWSFSWLKTWSWIGLFSFLESLCRNLSFSIMVIRMVNVVSEQGNYWVANNFIWNWLLLPTVSLADLVQKEIGEDRGNIRKKSFGYFLMVGVFIILWLISISVWKPFIEYVLNAENYQTVYNITLLETAFYLTFMFNNAIFDSTFYGLGLTRYLLYQSICIDLIYYGIWFILYITDQYTPTLKIICLMFGFGMLLDFIPAVILYVCTLKHEHIEIDFDPNPYLSENESESTISEL